MVGLGRVGPHCLHPLQIFPRCALAAFIGAIADEHPIIVEGCNDAFFQLAARIPIAGIDHSAANIVFGRFNHSGLSFQCAKYQALLRPLFSVELIHAFSSAAFIFKSGLFRIVGIGSPPLVRAVAGAAESVLAVIADRDNVDLDALDRTRSQAQGENRNCP